MADFTALKTAIQNAIKQNGNEEITGNLLQEVLLAIVTTLGDGSINDLITALGSEATTRSQADGTLQQNIDAEATTRSQADGTLQQNINAEAQARQLGDSTLQGGINSAMQAINAINNAIVNGCVYAGIATPSTTPAAGKVFYLALTAGTYTNFNGLEVSQGINILKNNGSTWSLDSFVGIDDAPAPSSQKLVKSGGVFDEVMKNGSAFDLSAYNGGATYADLNAALTALNALPAAYKRGGMSMKFVLSSDNKYVQWRLTSNTFTTTASEWQKQGAEVTVSQNSQTQTLNIGSQQTLLNSSVKGLPLSASMFEKGWIDDHGNPVSHSVLFRSTSYIKLKSIQMTGDYNVKIVVYDNNDNWVGFFNGQEIDTTNVACRQNWDLPYAIYSNPNYQFKLAGQHTTFSAFTIEDLLAHIQLFDLTEIGGNLESLRNGEVKGNTNDIEALRQSTGYYDLHLTATPDTQTQYIIGTATTPGIKTDVGKIKRLVGEGEMVGEKWRELLFFSDNTTLQSPITEGEATISGEPFGKTLIGISIQYDYSEEPDEASLSVKYLTNMCLLAVNDDTGKADKVENATTNDIATLDANGNLQDGGKKITDLQDKLSQAQLNATLSGITQQKVDAFEGMGQVNDTNFKGIFASASELPSATIGWAWVGTSPTAFNLYVCNNGTWVRFGTEQYNLTDYAHIASNMGVCVDDYEHLNVRNKWTNAIRAAVEAAGVGGTIRFSPNKTYEIDGGIDLLKDQVIIGNGAILKRAAEEVVELAQNVTSSTNTIVVTSVPNCWEIGDTLTIFTGASVNDVKGNFTITAINGTTITLGSNISNCNIGTYVSKSYNMMCSQQDPIPYPVKVFNLVFDGNKDNNDASHYWYRNGTIQIFGYGSIISGCKFVDIPNENISCQGAVIVDNYAQDLNGSFVHLSCPANSSLSVEEYKGTFVTNNFVKRSNIIDPAITGHSAAVVEQSWNPGRLIVMGNQFLGSGYAACYVIVDVNTPETGSNTGYKDEVIIANNYFRNYASICGAVSQDWEINKRYMFCNIFEDCGANNNWYKVGNKGAKWFGNQYVGTTGGTGLVYSPMAILNTTDTQVPTYQQLDALYGALPLGSIVYYYRTNKLYMYISWANHWTEIAHTNL